MAIDFAELKVRICEALGHLSAVSVDTNGFYYCECDKDYRDELEDSQIADILAGRHRFRVNGVEEVEHMEPMDALNNLLAEGYQEEMWRIEDEVLNEVKKHADVASFIVANGVDDDCLRDCLGDVWYVTVPVDDYLRQDVCMDIMLDTGDMNLGFACNNIRFSDIDSVEDFDDNSSLLWLCEQQGVTREELLAAYVKGSAHSDEVLQLRERKEALLTELKQLGFVSPRYEERYSAPVWHTGAYKEYARLQDNLVKQQAEVERLRSKYAVNNLSYQEYLKQHFDRFERLDPMSEEQFEIKKAEVLANLSGRLETVKAALAVTQEKLASSVDYGKIAKYQSELQDVRRKLTAVSDTDEYRKAEFIDSVRRELVNWPDNSTVIFLVKMPLETAIRLQEVIEGEASLNRSYDYNERTGRSSIVVGKDVRCGLMNADIGGGSVFEINLVKDAEIPIKAIYRAVPDCELGSYGFMSIYGMNDEPYEKELKAINEVEPEKVEDLIADAINASKQVNNDAVAQKDGWTQYNGAWIYPVEGGWEANLNGCHYDDASLELLKRKIDRAVEYLSEIDK